MLDPNTETLRQVLKAENANAVLSASKIPMQDFIGDLRYRQQKVWRDADALSPREVNRKAVTYHRWCGTIESNNMHSLLYPIVSIQGPG
eukprot:5753-Pelagomonas_calceolata.AAC.2